MAYGAYPAGSAATNTAAIQAAFEAGVGYFPPGDFTIDPDIGLFPPSGLHVWGPGRIVFAPSSAASYPGVKLNSVEGVTWDVDIVGDADTHTGDGSQGCHNLRVYGGSHNTISGAFTQAEGDGIFVDLDADGTIIQNVTVSNCGRHGVALAGQTNTTVDGVTASNIPNGGAVHVEPWIDQTSDNTTIRNVMATACLDGVTASGAASGSSCDNVTVEDCAVSGCTNDNVAYGSYKFNLVPTATLTRCTVANGASYGFWVSYSADGVITLTDCEATNNAAYGFKGLELAGNTAVYTLTRCAASANALGGDIWFEVTPVLVDCTGITG